MNARLVACAIVSFLAGVLATAAANPPRESWTAVPNTVNALNFPVLVNARTGTACMVVDLPDNAAAGEALSCIDYTTGQARSLRLHVSKLAR